MTLPRGFKAQAERRAVQVRESMGKREADPLSASDLADQMSIRLISADELVQLARLEELERLQAFAFSAATFEIGERKVIVFNPLRTTGRNASDIAHEIAHILLKHDLSEVREVDGLPFRTCNPEEEEQATALGGTLLLPRPLLMRAAARGMGPEQIAQHYNVTLDMARFRYNSTGVARQLASRR